MLYNGDCLDVMRTLPENSVHAVVTDPPYHLTSIVKRFGKEGSAPAKFGKDGAFARASKGFMGKEWDGGDIAFRHETWAEVLRVARPGGHLLAFGGTRTFHRIAVAIEDAPKRVRYCHICDDPLDQGGHSSCRSQTRWEDYDGEENEK